MKKLLYRGLLRVNLCQFLLQFIRFTSITTNTMTSRSQSSVFLHKADETHRGGSWSPPVALSWRSGQCAAGPPPPVQWGQSSCSWARPLPWKNLKRARDGFSPAAGTESFHRKRRKKIQSEREHLPGQGESSQGRMCKIFSSLELVYASSHILSYLATSSCNHIGYCVIIIKKRKSHIN